MELSSNSRISDGLLAAMTLLSEKPHQGVPSWESAPHQGIDERNCTALLGLQFRSSEIVSGTVVAPGNCSNGAGTGGVGIGAGYNADLGVGAAGASSTGGGGAGLFHNSSGGLSGGYSGGLFGSGGAAAYAGSHVVGAPNQNGFSFVVGGYAGAGANVSFTNAGGVQQLSGPFTTVSVNVGVGIANLGVQLSFGGGIWQFSVTPPIASVGAGAAFSVIRTNTVTTHAGCH